MSSVMIVPSLNSSSLNHKYDGFIYLSDILIQFSATTDASQNLTANSNYALNFPIASKPFAVYVSPLNPSTAAPTVSIINSSITDVSCNVRIGGNTGQLFWYSIGPAPTSPIYTPTFTNFSSYARYISMSSNGQYQYCCSGNVSSGTNGGVFINSGYGYGQWINKSQGSGSIYSIVTSSTGKYVYFSQYNSYLFHSSNYGNTFTATTNVNSGSLQVTIQVWQAMACSDDGSLVVACSNLITYGGIYISTNYGNSYIRTFTQQKNYSGATSNSSGQYLAVCVYGGRIYTSSDYGSTWTQTSAPNANWTSITSDNTGQYISASIYGGRIYTSSDYGSTWTQTSAPNANWNSISSNNTGQYLTAVANGTGIWNSNDYGNTWFQMNASTIDYTGVSINDTGNIVSVCSNTSIYVSLNGLN
jgi:hypothetical protein